MPKKDNNITYQPNQKDIMIMLPLVCFTVGFYDGFLARERVVC